MRSRGFFLTGKSYQDNWRVLSGTVCKWNRYRSARIRRGPEVLRKEPQLGYHRDHGRGGFIPNPPLSWLAREMCVSLEESEKTLSVPGG